MKSRFFAFVQPFALPLLLAASLEIAPALGSPAGELDTSFGDHGRILMREERFADMYGVKAFVDPASGKLLVAATGWGENELLRFHSDGSRDLSFGDQGAVTPDLGENSLNLYDVELLSDGKLLIAGAMNVYGDPQNVIHGVSLLARMHADGTPDVSFGNHGLVILQLGGVYESFVEILVQADDSIVVFGSTDRTGRSEWILARYTKDGLPDTGFGDAATPGISTVSFVADNEVVLAIVQQTDGTFMACGNIMSSDRSPILKEVLVVRIRADGLRDGTFGSNGRVLLGGQQTALEAQNCLALADGHLVIAGNSGTGEQLRGAILRMAPDGSLDAGFGDHGMVTLPMTRFSTIQAMLLMSDGALAIAGSSIGTAVDASYPWISWIDMLVARVDPVTGDIDQQFGDGGASSVDFGMSSHASRAVPASLVQQADGKLVVVGTQIDPGDWSDFPYVAIARLDPYGSGSNGWAGLNQTFVRAPAGGGETVLHVRRTGGSTGPLSVDYRTVDDTATAGTDYIAVSGTLSWPDGDMGEQEIPIAVSTGHLATDFEHFNVELFNSSGGLAVDQARIGLSRNEPPSPPPGGGNNSGNASGNASGSGGGSGGVGAIGIESWFLAGLAMLGFLRRRSIRGQFGDSDRIQPGVVGPQRKRE